LISDRFLCLELVGHFGGKLAGWLGWLGWLSWLGWLGWKRKSPHVQANIKILDIMEASKRSRLLILAWFC